MIEIKLCWDCGISVRAIAAGSREIGLLNCRQCGRGPGSSDLIKIKPCLAGALTMSEKPQDNFIPAPTMYKKILLPTDGCPISRKAVKHGIALAKHLRAEVVGFFAPPDYRVMMYSDFVPPLVVSEKEFKEQSAKAAHKQLSFVEKAASAAGVRYEGCYIASIAPWQAIIEAARSKKCDLICMGSHGRSGVIGVVLGSQTTKVLTHSKIPVLVTR